MSGGEHKEAYFVEEFFNDTELALQPDNATNSSAIDNYYYYETEQLATLGVLLISIVLGNMSVLLALMLTKRRKSRVNFFIQHLALADLSVGLVNVLTDLVWKITLEWNAGNKTCKLVRYSQGVVTYSSTYVLVALTIDRYDAIRHPMNFSSGHRKARYLVAIAWLLSCFFSAPLLYLFELKMVQNRFQCWIELPEQVHWQLYMTLVSITLFFLPALIIAACYAVIVYTIWTKGSKLIIKPKKSHSSNGASIDNDTKRVSSRGIIPKAKVKTVKMTLVIVFVFIACWSPYMIYNLLTVYKVLNKTQTGIAVATFIQSLAPLNSAVNPIIYWCFSTYLCRDFRSKPQWMESRTGRSTRITDSTNMSLTMSSARMRTYQLHPITPAEKKLIIRSVSVMVGSCGGLSERARAFSIEQLVASADTAHATPNGTILWHKGVGAELCSPQLWQQFADHGTEMLLTKAGRRMFPSLKVRFYGLSPSSSYLVYMDVLPVTAHRFRYLHQSSQWISTPNTATSRRDDATVCRTYYVHPDSPGTGMLWNSQAHVSFHQVKINNNRGKHVPGHITLESMRKYQPRVHVLLVQPPTPDPCDLVSYIQHNAARASVFTFPITEFVTVTAYQNQSIAYLKITTNPFAKGYRQVDNNNRGREKKGFGGNRPIIPFSAGATPRGKLVPVTVVFPLNSKLTYHAAGAT